MNKIYRVIWNHATQTWTVVSELAKSSTKTKSEKAILTTAISLALLSGGIEAATLIEDGRATARTSTNSGSIIIRDSAAGEQNVIIGSRLTSGVTSASAQSIAIGNDITLDGRGRLQLVETMQLIHKHWVLSQASISQLLLGKPEGLMLLVTVRLM